MEIRKAYEWYDVVGKYSIPRLLVGAILIGSAAAASLVMGLPGIFDSFLLRLPVLLVPVYLAAVVILYPVLDFDRRKMAIDSELHIFITRMGAISLSEIAEYDIFRIMSQSAHRSPITDEIARIYNRVEHWGINLAEACRVIARSSPSKIFTDFLNRFAHAMDSGEPPSEFFMKEQQVVMEEFALEYEKSLYAIDLMKEVFVALMTTAAFVMVIVALYPNMTGESGLYLLVLAIFVFGFIEMSFLYFLKMSMPEENLWHTTGIDTRVDRAVRKKMFYSAGVCGAVGAAQLVLWALPAFDISLVLVPLMLAISVTPLLYVSLYVDKQERLIKRKEDNFPAFIRSLGGSSETGNIGATRALRDLQHHDFGPLTRHIRDLYKRLSLNIDSEKSWEYFGAEMGSDLSARFGTMYVEGASVGGSARKVSRMISENMLKIIGLRKKRYQSASAMIGVLYGIGIAVTLSVYVSVGMINAINDMYEEMEIPGQLDDFSVFFEAAFTPGVLHIAALIVVLQHVMTSSVMIKITGGGRMEGALTHLVGMLWMSGITAILSQALVDYLL